MAKRNIQMLSDFIALSGGELVSKIAGFIAFAYLARTLEPNAYGAVELAVALSVLFTLLVDFGFGPVGARTIAKDKKVVAAYASRIPSARMLFSLAAIPLMALSVLAMDQPSETVYLVWLFALGLAGAPWNQRWLLQGLEMMSWVSIGQMLRMTIFMAGVILWVEDSSQLLHVGYIEILATVSMAGYFMFIQQKRITPVRLDFNLAGIRILVNQAFSIGMSQVIWALNLYLPIIIIGVLAGSEDVAWFGAAHRIVVALITFSMIYHFNMFPTISRKLGESHDSFSRVVTPSYNLSAAGGIFEAFTGTILADPLCRFVYGETFSVAALPLMILVWLVPVHVLSGHARWALIATDHQRWVLYAQLGGAVVTVITGSLLIPAYGALGGSISMVTGSIVIWVVSHLAVLRFIGPLPFFRMVWQPLLLAGAGIGIVSVNPDLYWQSVLLVSIGYIVLAPLIQRHLVRDFRALVGAKGHSAAVPPEVNTGA